MLQKCYFLFLLFSMCNYDVNWCYKLCFCIYSVQALRDTGALQSLVSSEVLHNDDFVHTGETPLIYGVPGKVFFAFIHAIAYIQ